MFFEGRIFLRFLYGWYFFLGPDNADPPAWMSVTDAGMYARKYSWCQLWFNCFRETIDVASASISYMYRVAYHSDPDPNLQKIQVEQLWNFAWTVQFFIIFWIVIQTFRPDYNSDLDPHPCALELVDDNCMYIRVFILDGSYALDAHVLSNIGNLFHSRRRQQLS